MALEESEKPLDALAFNAELKAQVRFRFSLGDPFGSGLLWFGIWGSLWGFRSLHGLSSCALLLLALTLAFFGLLLLGWPHSFAGLCADSCGICWSVRGFVWNLLSCARICVGSVSLSVGVAAHLDMCGGVVWRWPRGQVQAEQASGARGQVHSRLKITLDSVQGELLAEDNQAMLRINTDEVSFSNRVDATTASLDGY
eukprot:2012453-Rhodomonas_salina.1